MVEEYQYFTFSADVLGAVHKKLWALASTYDTMVDNTSKPYVERTHFLSSNITTIINRIFRAGSFSVSQVKYKIEDYDEMELSEAQVAENRRSFLKEIENCDNILEFIFLTFLLN